MLGFDTVKSPLVLADLAALKENEGSLQSIGAAHSLVMRAAETVWIEVPSVGP